MPGHSDTAPDVDAPDAGDERVEPVDDAAQPDTAPEGDGADSGDNPHREAAKYRTRLREVESERDGLSAQLDAMRRAEVVRVAGETLARGDDLLTYRGDDLAGYLADDGSVSAERVGEAVEALVAERGQYLTGKRFLGTADTGHLGKPIGSRQPTRMGAIFSDDA